MQRFEATRTPDRGAQRQKPLPDCPICVRPWVARSLLKVGTREEGSGLNPLEGAQGYGRSPMKTTMSELVPEPRVRMTWREPRVLLHGGRRSGLEEAILARDISKLLRVLRFEAR